MRINRGTIGDTGTHAARIGGPVRKLAASRYVALPVAIALAAAIAISVAVAQPRGSGDDDDASPHATSAYPGPVQAATMMAESLHQQDRILHEFIASGIELKTLPHTGIMITYALPRHDLASATDSADVIVLGTVVDQRMEYAPGFSFRSRVVSTIEVDEWLKGGADRPTIGLEEFGIITLSGPPGAEDYVFAPLPADPPLRRGQQALLFGVTSGVKDSGLIEPSGLEGRMARIPGTALLVRSDGRVEPTSGNVNIADMDGRPLDEVLQLLRDLTAGGP
jgi:hypothetical protein